MRLVYSPEAVADLVRLRAFIADQDPAAAARVAADLLARMDSLAAFPEMGGVVPQAPSPGAIRDFVFDKYVVRYTQLSTALVVLRVWHQHERRQGGRQTGGGGS